MTKRVQAAIAVVLLTACGDAAGSADSTATTVDPTPTTVATTSDGTTTDPTTTTIIPTITPTTTTTTAITATTTTATTTVAEPQDDTAAVLAAYAAHWAIFYAFLNGEPPGDPADYFAGARLADLPGQIANAAEEGLEGGGAPQLAPGEVTIDGEAASFTDCQLDLTFAVSRSTGETVVPASTRPQAVAVEMLRSGGVWKVSSVVYDVEGSCVQ